MIKPWCWSDAFTEVIDCKYSDWKVNPTTNNPLADVTISTSTGKYLRINDGQIDSTNSSSGASRFNIDGNGNITVSGGSHAGDLLADNGHLRLQWGSDTLGVPVHLFAGGEMLKKPDWNMPAMYDVSYINNHGHSGPGNGVEFLIYNSTNQNLTKTQQHDKEKFDVDAPAVIHPHQVGIVVASAAMMRGPEGGVTYRDDKGYIFGLDWNVPAIGDNQYKATIIAPHDLKVAATDLAGNKRVHDYNVVQNATSKWDGEFGDGVAPVVAFNIGSDISPPIGTKHITSNKCDSYTLAKHHDFDWHVIAGEDNLNTGAKGVLDGLKNSVGHILAPTSWEDGQTGAHLGAFLGQLVAGCDISKG